MSVVHKNVAVLDFTVLPSRPRPIEIEKFVTRELKVQCKELKSVQVQLTSGRTLIEFHDPAAAEIAVTKNMRHSIQCGEKAFAIPVFFKQDTVQVRIFDLPSEMPSEKIIHSLKQYGKVLSIEDEKWKKYFVGLANGVKLLHMTLDRPIPKRLKINGCFGTIIYKGQIRERLNRKKSKQKTDATKVSNKTKNSNNTSINNNQEKQQDKKKQELPRPPACTKQQNQQHNNNSSNDNINNAEDEPKPDEEGFETVLSRRERGALKRQHSKEDADSNGKLSRVQRTEFFHKRFLEAKRKYTIAVDDVSKLQALRLQHTHMVKFWECFEKLTQEEKVMIEEYPEVHEDFK